MIPAARRSRPTVRLLVAGALLAAAAGAGLGVALHSLQGAGSSSKVTLPDLYGQAVWSAGARPAPAFVLQDQTGRLVGPTGSRRPVVLAFMDPLCRTACSLEGRALAAVEQELVPADRPTLLVVSLNPAATHAEALSAAREWGFSGDWHWLLGTRPELAHVWRAYGLGATPARRGSQRTPVYVIDTAGFVRVGVHAPFLPQFVADDVSSLERGSS